MKQIPLSKGKFALVDDEDYEYLMQWIWFCKVDKRGREYAVRNCSDGGKRTTLPMHRVIMNTPDGMETDHRYGDGLNNQRYNLRICTKNQNQHNQTPRSNTRSKYKGVDFHKPSNKWRARIMLNKRHIQIGMFESEVDAAQAYNFAATEHHGDFAHLNKIAA